MMNKDKDQAAGVVPAGWKLVPIEPTMGMLDEAGQRLSREKYRATTALEFMADAHAAWDGMLAAAPQPPAVQQPAEQAAPVAESQADALSDAQIVAIADKFWEVISCKFDEIGFARAILAQVPAVRGESIVSEEFDEKLVAWLEASNRLTGNGNGAEYDALVAFIDRFAALSAPAAPVPAASEGWIAATDRMPETMKEVMAWEKWSRVPFIGYWTGKAWTTSTEHYRVAGDGWMDDNLSQNLITHWQPLPAAPATSDKAEGV